MHSNYPRTIDTNGRYSSALYERPPSQEPEYFYQNDESYDSHRSQIDPAMKQRLNELVETAKRYRTKACGMQKVIGLQPPSSFDIEVQRLNRRSLVRKPPVPKPTRPKSSNNHSHRSNQSQRSQPSLKQLTQGEDFMEFLKRVELYTTDENSPAKNLLVSNLQFIREKYKEYKADSNH